MRQIISLQREKPKALFKSSEKYKYAYHMEMMLKNIDVVDIEK